MLPHRLRVPFAQLPDVTQYQIVREPHRLAIRIVLGERAAADTPARIAAALQAALEDAGAIPPPSDVEPVAAIEREPGSAKLKLIKSIAHAPPPR